MAATGVSSVKCEKSSRTFAESLSSAFLEWMLLFLLFVNALFSYLTTKFAHYCHLQTPCLLCSRLDHILGNARLGFYWDMICSHHKSEISSLVLCHAHCKLVDVHGICENCLFSFATINKSNAETYRLLVGKLGVDSDSDSSEKQEISSEGHRIGKSSMKLCTCCNKPWIPRGPTQTLIQTTSILCQLTELDVPLSGVIGALKNIGDGSSKRINRGINDLSHVGYTELKITSDSESEVPFSDDDEINSLASKPADLREKYGTESTVDPLIISSGDTAVKLEEQGSVEQSSASLPEMEVDATKVQKGESVGTNVGHGLEDINWQNSDIKDKDALASVVELISFDDFPSNANNGATFEKLSSETCKCEPPYVSPPTEPCENELPVRETNEAPEKDEETFKVDIEPISAILKPVEANLVSTDSIPQVPNLPDLGEGCKLAVGNHERKLSGVLTEQCLSKDSSSRVSGDLKSMISQSSAQRGIDKSSAPDLSPKISLNSEDSLKTLDYHQKRILLERNESNPPEPSAGETNEAMEKDSEETSKIETEPIKMTENPVETNLVSTNSSPQVPNLPDLGEAYKHAMGNHGRKLSGVLAEQWLSKDSSSRISGDLKNLFSQLSTPRGIDQSSAPDLSPKIPLNSEDSLKNPDAHQKRISLERNESIPSEPSVKETNEAPEKVLEETLKVEAETFTTENPVEANLLSSDSSPRVPNQLDLGEAYKLAVGNHGRQLSGVLTEQWLSKDSSSRISEDLKNLFLQFSAPRGIDQSSAPDLSPKMSLNSEDSLKTMDALQKRISLDRNESGLSQDGSLVSEIEGESTIDRLKRQIEHDRRALSALYRELEEERNASAVAANQAMAMITRLQEEKASLQMEALQYLRMMEEQAEYDMEALQKSNDLLTEREKEIQDLEEELEYYRINFGDVDQIPGSLDIHLKAGSMGTSGLNYSAIGFEDERSHILESLKNLETKLGLSSGEEVISDSVHCESRCSGKEDANVCCSAQNDVSLPRDVNLGPQVEQETSPDDSTGKGDCAGKSSSITSQGANLTSIKNEVWHLQKRLEALEADRDFLERTVKHLGVGEEGLQFVRDIASRLQEIRNAM